MEAEKNDIWIPSITFENTATKVSIDLLHLYLLFFRKQKHILWRANWERLKTLKSYKTECSHTESMFHEYSSLRAMFIFWLYLSLKFEVDNIGDDGDNNFSHYNLPNFKQL